MGDTVLRSRSREVFVGPDRPLVLVGERINPTGRKALAAELLTGDLSRVQRDALAQVGAGARMLDVNVGIPLVDEAALLARAVRLIQSLVDVPLCLDSSVPAALEAGLDAYEGKALVNSVTGEEERLEAVLPLVAKHGAAVVALAHDEHGISEDAGTRFAAAQRIVARAADYGIPAVDVLVDPLVLPVGTTPDAARTVLELLPRLREELGVNTICGVSNVSFGLPNRDGLNATFLGMLIAAGLTSVIANPLNGEVARVFRAAETLLGRDEYCMGWIRAYREPASGPVR